MPKLSEEQINKIFRISKNDQYKKEDGKLNISKIAKDIGCGRSSVYRYLFKSVRRREMEYTRKINKSGIQRKRQRNYTNRVKTNWRKNIDIYGKEGIPLIDQEIPKIIESLSGKMILPKEGFENIMHTGGKFPFDFIVNKDGRESFIEVTTAYKKLISQYRRNLVRRFKFDFYLLFVLPDFSKYKIHNVGNRKVVKCNSFKQMKEMKETGYWLCRECKILNKKSDKLCKKCGF